MNFLFSHRGFLRCICLCTASTMLPASVQAWHFLPAVQTLIPSADDGPAPLPSDKVAELNTVNAAAPAPLSAEQRAALQSDTPASAETKVVAANNAVALPNLNLGAVKPSDQVGLRYMDREELSQIASSVPPERPLHNPALPEAADVLARIQSAVSSTPEEETPVKVAQAAGAPTLPGEREVRGPRGPQEAVAALAEADDLAGAGHRAEALKAYFDVMDIYGGTNEALWADQGMWNTLNELAAGSATVQSIAEFESHLAQWAPQTVDGAYAAVTWDAERALAEHKRGNAESALAYAGLAESRSLAFIEAHGSSYLSMSAADYYQEMVNLQGPEKERGAMLALWDRALQMEHGPGRLGALYAFGSHAASIPVNAASDAIIAWSNVLSEMKQPFVAGLLEDGVIPFWAKGFICEYAGRAHAGLGDYEQAKVWYDRGLPSAAMWGPPTGFSPTCPP